MSPTSVARQTVPFSAATDLASLAKTRGGESGAHIAHAGPAPRTGVYTPSAFSCAAAAGPFLRDMVCQAGSCSVGKATALPRLVSAQAPRPGEGSQPECSLPPGGLHHGHDACCHRLGLHHGPMAGGCSFPGTRKVLAGLPDRDRIIEKADGGRRPKAIRGIPGQGYCRERRMEETKR